MPGDNAAANQWFSRDPALYAASQALPADKVAPYIIDAAFDWGLPNGLPQGGETVVSFPNNHLGYAITWFGLAAALAGVFAVFAWRRIHAGNWCNQSGAGLGERPTAAPAAGIDAYVWVKPPGESDGSSAAIPNDEGKGFDRMCDPTYGGNPRNGNNPTGALPNSPVAGHWFSAQFRQLMQNAYPPLP